MTEVITEESKTSINDVMQSIFVLIMLGIGIFFLAKGMILTFFPDFNSKLLENSLKYSNTDINNRNCNNYYKLEYYQDGAVKTVECQRFSE